MADNIKISYVYDKEKRKRFINCTLNFNEFLTVENS